MVWLEAPFHNVPRSVACSLPADDETRKGSSESVVVQNRISGYSHARRWFHRYTVAERFSCRITMTGSLR